MTQTVTRPNWKKFFIQMLVGAVIGGVSAMLVLRAWKSAGPLEPAQLIAIVAGLIYGLMGLMVGFGAISPRAGARVLNVEDVDDLRAQRTVLALSSAACVAIGLLFLILAAVPAGRAGALFSREWAAVLVGICLAAVIALAMLTNRMVDELTRHISMESAALTMQASFIVFGSWAALAHLGFVAWIAPLALVAGMALLQLLAIFWVSGKRGLLVPQAAPPPRSN